MFGHLEAVWLTLEEDFTLEDIKQTWADFKEVSISVDSRSTGRI